MTVRWQLNTFNLHDRKGQNGSAEFNAKLIQYVQNIPLASH